LGIRGPQYSILSAPLPALKPSLPNLKLIALTTEFKFKAARWFGGLHSIKVQWPLRLLFPHFPVPCISFPCLGQERISIASNLCFRDDAEQRAESRDRNLEWLDSMASGDAGPSGRALKREKVTILSAKGLKLAGELGDTGSRDLCILCHGFRSSRADPSLVTLAAALAGAAFSTYRFDFTGNGESEGAFAYGSYWREAEDLRSVVNYWRFRGWRVVSLIGHSKGGNAVLLYASKYGDVACIVNVSGRFDLSKGMSR
jgi:hypothetical protein